MSLFTSFEDYPIVKGGHIWKKNYIWSIICKTIELQIKKIKSEH